MTPGDATRKAIRFHSTVTADVHEKEALMESILALILAVATVLAPADALAQAAPWDGSYGNQCCTCCEGGTVVGRERQCVTTTTDRCRARGWVCYGYVLCPK